MNSYTYILFCLLGVVYLASTVTAATVSFNLAARGLITKEEDEDDGPDPFAKVFKNGGSAQRSETLTDKQFPQWSYRFSFTYVPSDRLTVELTDNDTGGDDIMGSVDVSPVDLDKDVDRDIRGHGLWAGRIRFLNVVYS
ncbi:unnamed protein product [Orchesella dallaii]|uniref:C2 domain-containing protein n=1 Tax=Orchesella dallaii TaxID=48710 RepID=A0ABP1PSA7_9HEXA